MMGSAHEEDRGSRKTKWDFNRNAWLTLAPFLILISAAAKSHAMKALGPREPLCPSSSPGLLQRAGTSSSAKLFCWGGGVWRTTFFQRLHGLPRNDHQFTDDESNLWVTLVEKSSGRYRASEPDSVWWCRGFRLAGPLAEPLIGYKIESESPPQPRWSWGRRTRSRTRETQGSCWEVTSQYRIVRQRGRWRCYRPYKLYIWQWRIF